MQRDMNLVREILLKLEEHEHGFAPGKVDIQGYSAERIGYHVHLMGEAGLLRVANTTALESVTPSARPLSIMWAGYEFLANAKDENTWRKITSSTMSRAGTLSFEVLEAWLVAEMRRWRNYRETKSKNGVEETEGK